MHIDVAPEALPDALLDALGDGVVAVHVPVQPGFCQVVVTVHTTAAAGLGVGPAQVSRWDDDVVVYDDGFAVHGVSW